MLGNAKDWRMQDAFVILDLVKSVAIPSTGGMSVRVTKTVLARIVLKLVSVGMVNVRESISLNVMKAVNATILKSVKGNHANVQETFVNGIVTLRRIAIK